MPLRIVDGDIHLHDVKMRMPFKYGIATMTQAPQAYVRLRLEIDGALATGIAADFLPPKWFTKDPQRPIDDEIDEMLRGIEQALRLAVGLRGETAFDLWRTLYEAQDAWGRSTGLPPLLTHFGTSLVERCAIEAVCRQAGKPFAEMLRSQRLGLRLGEWHPELAAARLEELLPAAPRQSIIARHTVGLLDPLTDGEIAPAERLDDGLPQSLAACIEAYGLRHFKFKLCGQVAADIDRLRRIAAVVAEHGPRGFAFTADGNEQFRSFDAFRQWWTALLDCAELRDFWPHLLFVEQPFHRDVALDEGELAPLRAWTDRPPLIIDESDSAPDSLPRALALGYRGASHKNCKGVFRGAINACVIARLRAEQPSRPLILSGEDLANIGPVALLADLAVAATLGIESVERNGHHFVAGLSMFPETVRRQMLDAHGDLYRRSRDGWPTLDVRDGRLALSSVLAAPLGVWPEIDVSQFTPLEAWKRNRRSPRETLP